MEFFLRSLSFKRTMVDVEHLLRFIGFFCKMCLEHTETLLGLLLVFIEATEKADVLLLSLIILLIRGWWILAHAFDSGLCYGSQVYLSEKEFIMFIIFIVLGAVAVLLLFWVIGMYNKLVVGRNRVKNAYAQIDVQLTRRYDLIPNLVETAKGYMKHERETLEAVTEARNQAAAAAKAVGGDPTNAGAMKSLIGAEGALAGSLGRLNVAVEAYPDLKASANMMQVQEELTTTENKVSFARQGYNDSVMHYNVMREKFPDNIIAGMFNFSEAQMFEIEDASVKEAPKVDFS